MASLPAMERTLRMIQESAGRVRPPLAARGGASADEVEDGPDPRL